MAPRARRGPADAAGRDRVRAVFFTSEAGWAFTPGFGPYNVSKRPRSNNLGASLAAEVAARHPGADVQVNVLNPGEARTEMNQGSSVSPYSVVSMTLALLSHPPGGPNGCFLRPRRAALGILLRKSVGKPGDVKGVWAGNRARSRLPPIRSRCVLPATRPSTQCWADEPASVNVFSCPSS